MALGRATLFLSIVARTREPRRVRAHVAPLVRAGAAITFALALTWLVPTIGLDSRDTERAVLALVAFGIVTAATRRATLFQVLGHALRTSRPETRRHRSASNALRALRPTPDPASSGDFSAALDSYSHFPLLGDSQPAYPSQIRSYSSRT